METITSILASLVMVGAFVSQLALLISWTNRGNEVSRLSQLLGRAQIEAEVWRNRADSMGWKSTSESDNP